MTAIVPKPFRIAALSNGESIVEVDFLEEAEKTAVRDDRQLIPGVFVPQALLDRFAAGIAPGAASILLNAITPGGRSVSPNPGE